MYLGQREKNVPIYMIPAMFLKTIILMTLTGNLWDFSYDPSVANGHIIATQSQAFTSPLSLQFVDCPAAIMNIDKMSLDSKEGRQSY
jgi:hypothetical protein